MIKKKNKSRAMKLQPEELSQVFTDLFQYPGHLVHHFLVFESYNFNTIIIQNFCSFSVIIFVFFRFMNAPVYFYCQLTFMTIKVKNKLVNCMLPANFFSF